MSDLRRIAVILAGGTGTRVGLNLPKQLITIAGKTIIEHTIAAFQASPLIDDIIILMAPGHLDAVRAIVRSGDYPKVSMVIEGAATRNETTQLALDALTRELGSDDALILIHDAVRPLVSEEIIRANVEALAIYDAVDTAIDSADTIVVVDQTGSTIKDVPPRQTLRRGQTPQSFRLSVLRDAYSRASLDADFQATDDCTVVLRYSPGVPIGVVPGEASNLKVTDPIDVHVADKLFQLTSRTTEISKSELSGELRDKTLVVFGGSYGIGSAIAEIARSYGARVMNFSRSETRTHVERRADVRAAASQSLAELGNVDFVVNAAGVLPRGSLAMTSEESVFHATEVNYLGPVWIAQEFHAALQQSRGSLLLFTSSSYTRGRAGYSLYSSAKAAVVNLTQALADEWRSDGVRINCLNPERTATPMRERAFGDEPADSLLDPHVVARRALEVLVSGLTGQVVDVRRHQSPAQTSEIKSSGPLAT